jgi:hypothetical protein
MRGATVKIVSGQQAKLSNNTRLKLLKTNAAIWFNSVLNRNFNKEQSMLPEDDRMIGTCRGVLSVLM